MAPREQNRSQETTGKNKSTEGKTQIKPLHVHLINTNSTVSQSGVSWEKDGDAPLLVTHAESATNL